MREMIKQLHDRSRRMAASGRLSFFGGAPVPGMCPGAGAQYKARDDEALGLVRLLGQVDVVRAHILLEGKRKAAVFCIREPRVPLCYMVLRACRKGHQGRMQTCRYS